MKVFVARPVVPGGSGFCHATIGELMMFGSGNKALVGFKSHKGSTALQVVELDENKALELYKQGWARADKVECIFRPANKKGRLVFLLGLPKWPLRR